jgi:hypothetical protein
VRVYLAVLLLLTREAENARHASQGTALTSPCAEARGGVKNFRDEDIARLFDSLALELAERLRAAPDSEASLTLVSVMKELPDLCRKYFEFVLIGLRDATPQAAVDLVRSLALMKAGPSADFKYDYQAMTTNNEINGLKQSR